MRLSSSLLVVVVFALARSSEAGVIVSDDNLHTDWAYGGLFTTGVGSSTFTFEMNADTGGNPDKFRIAGASHGGSSPQDITALFFSFDTGFVFDPSLGPLTSLSISFDSVIVQDELLANYVAIGAGLRQGGRVFYDRGDFELATFDWQNYQFNSLMQNDFISAGTTLPQINPDFSSSGAPIEFGYYGYATRFFTTSAKIGVDNWLLEVNSQSTSNTATVPEPSSFALVIIGTLSLLGCRRRRNGVMKQHGA